jgi:hypothetical protein
VFFLFKYISHHFEVLVGFVLNPQVALIIRGFELLARACAGKVILLFNFRY